MVKVIFFAVVGSYLMLCVKPKKKKKQEKESQWFRTFYVRIVQWLLYNCIASWGKLGSRLCRAFYWSLIWWPWVWEKPRKCLKFCIPKSVRTLAVEGKTGSKLSIIHSERNEPRGAAPFRSPPLALAPPFACCSRVTSCVTSQTSLMWPLKRRVCLQDGSKQDLTMFVAQDTK